jgi:DNA-binding MarR family transcriptional regulator
MENQEIRTLRIFEAVESDQTITQRDLSKKLDISLGLVNSFIKRLVQKGFFKISTIPKNRVKYILTPKGAAEKTRLTYKYLQTSLRFYRESRSKLKALFIDFKKQKINRIVFCGTGDLAEIAYLSIQETDLILIAVIGEGSKRKYFFNQKIQDYSILSGMEFDKILIVEDRIDYIEIDRLVNIGIDASKIQKIIG